MGLGHGMNTPLSMPTSGETIPSESAVGSLDGFQSLQPHQFHHFDPFIQAQPSQGSYAPSHFVHQDTGYETMEQDGSPMDSDPAEEAMKSIGTTLHGSPMLSFHPRTSMGSHRGFPLPSTAGNFRFHSTLNAPTAMIKNAEEIPITYLNKGQAYSLSIADTEIPAPVEVGTRYRTFVRVSFEDEEQQQKPGVCWGLWKEGRGTNESHQRGGKLQAVEFVEAGQSADLDDRKARIQLEMSSFDGFSVIWTPGLHGAPEVNIAVRFNFLSTDFSHSKGVKGIPVRFCSKTTVLAPNCTQPTVDSVSETCFCKVKLFRDHGAERKLSNDVAHVKKSIDKVKQSIAQAESGLKEFGKRKRSGGISKAESKRPGKVQKHKRTWSMSSTSSADGGAGGAVRMTAEEDLHFKLQTLQDMFTSTRPVSLLYLKGEELDDPDLHPVAMPGDVMSPERMDGPRDGAKWQSRASRNSIGGSLASPTSDSHSIISQASGPAHGHVAQKRDLDQVLEEDLDNDDRPTKVAKTDDEGKMSGWIEALGVDPAYQPPPERTPKPVACFYMLRQELSEAKGSSLHRAVYLMERSLAEFNQRIAQKWHIEPSKISKTVHVLESGLEIEMDDDVIRELKEGQDMRLEVEEHQTKPLVKREWDMPLDDEDMTSTASPPPPTPSQQFTLRCSF